MKKQWTIILIMCMAAIQLNAQQFPNPLFIPDTLVGDTFDLEVKTTKTAFLPGDSTNTYGINQNYLGPTLIMEEGQNVLMRVTNHLGETTTMHWHGMHVAPEDDGGPHTTILNDSTWEPDFEVLDEATTFWYHPHLHHFTAKHVYMGAAGMILVRDDNPVGDQLPHTYGVDEFPLIVQDKSFDSSNQLIFTILADTMMVNGTLSPHLDVPAQMVRFHLLNASMQRVYNFGFDTNVDAWFIGSDGGLLETRVPTNRIILAPGERMEIVVDFSTHLNDSIVLKSYSSELEAGLLGGPKGPKNDPRFIPNQLDSSDFDVIQFRVTAPTTNAITSIPFNLNTYDRPAMNEVDRERTKVFTVDSSGFPFYINGALMDMDVINDTVELDDTEIWTIINNTDVGHPWHIHDIQFYILDINGTPPPLPLAGRKDVVMVYPGDTIRYITTFDDFANDSIPYMYHCHNLFHEDGGMMGQFIVINTTSLEEVASKSKLFKVVPNPTQGELKLISNEGAIEINAVQIMNESGRVVMTRQYNSTQSELPLDISAYPKGIYFLTVLIKGERVETVKVVHQ